MKQIESKMTKVILCLTLYCTCWDLYRAAQRHYLYPRRTIQRHARHELRWLVLRKRCAKFFPLTTHSLQTSRWIMLRHGIIIGLQLDKLWQIQGHQRNWSIANKKIQLSYFGLQLHNYLGSDKRCMGFERLCHNLLNDIFYLQSFESK